MTKKLYYQDSYQREVTCKIIEVVQEKEKIEVVLDQTIFYPEGGGQPSDLGTINGIPVIHVREQGETIYHQMPERPNGEIARCEIDWQRRFHHMQQHSGEHILSGAFLKLFQGNNKGFHMGEDYFTIDIDIKNMTDEMLEQAELEANKHIYRNDPVLDVITDREGLKEHKPRKQVAVDEDIRVITMGEIDCCACCGTHVKRLGEIGVIKILKAESYKGMTRIYALCGEQAFKDYILKNDIIKSLKKSLSAEEDTIVERVEKLRNDMNILKRQLTDQKTKTAKEIEKTLTVSGNVLKLVLEDHDFDTILQLESLIKDKYTTLILGSGQDAKLLVETKDQALDIGKIFKENIKQYTGKGGGNSERAQASFPGEKEMKEFIEKGLILGQ